MLNLQVDLQKQIITAGIR